MSAAPALLCVLGTTALCFLAAACYSPQDPRQADVVVDDPDLELATSAALAFWFAAAPGQLEARIVPSCGPDRSCVHVSWADLEDPVAGHTTRYGGVTHVLIARSLTDPAEVQTTVAHEYGHALGMPHVKDPNDVMSKDAGPHACTGPQTQAAWRDEYGSELLYVCL